jgi:hypothetical protein
MSKRPDEERTWGRKAEPKKDRSTLDELREEVRRRSEEAKRYHALTHDYPQKS